jgi:NAD(P)-dependent dehydrogenase (short-subunit alcohol dehydrogenase family)
MNELHGKVAVVTGGGSGLGRGMAVAFAEAGMKVVVADIDLAAGERVAREVRGIAVATDVTRPDSVLALADRAFAEYGAVHLLCNNGGGARPGPIDELTPDDWRRGLSVSLDSVINGLLAFLPRMRDQEGEAHIVNTASWAGVMTMKGHAVECASGFAVVAISEALREEAVAYGVGVTVLYPAIVKPGTPANGSSQPAEPANSRSWTDAMRARLVSAITKRAELVHAPNAVDAGRMVRTAVEADEFYIFTHRGRFYREQVEARKDRILKGFRRGSTPGA